MPQTEPSDQKRAISRRGGLTRAEMYRDGRLTRKPVKPRASAEEMRVIRLANIAKAHEGSRAKWAALHAETAGLTVAPRVPAPPASCSAAELYREEKVAFQARQAARLAGAEVAYQAMLEREAAWRKGGRPKLTCGKAQRKRDPANALIEALAESSQ